jgi:tetratricopeptide (TPR) repeat protein
MKDPDRTIKLLEGYEEKYQSLPEKVKADLFPDAIFTRLKASVMKEELPGAIKELDRLLDKYPKSPDVVEAFKYVAGVYMKEADKRDKEIEGLKKEIEAGPAKADELKKAGKTEEAAALEKGLKDSKDKVTALDGEAGGFRVKAADLYHKLIAKAPKQDCSIYLFSADTYFVNRVYDKAAEMYGRFLATCERDPKFVDKIIEIKSRLGESLYHLRDYEKALQFLSVVEASYTDKAKRFSIRPMINHCSKAIALKLMKDPKKKDEAAKHFTNALNGWAVLKNSIQPLTEEWWEATYEIGDILYWTAGYDKALGHLGSHILMYPQMGGANWKPKFLDLGKRLKEKLKKPTDVQRIDDIIGKLSK